MRLMYPCRNVVVEMLIVLGLPGTFPWRKTCRMAPFRQGHLQLQPQPPALRRRLAANLADAHMMGIDIGADAMCRCNIVLSH